MIRTSVEPDGAGVPCAGAEALGRTAMGAMEDGAVMVCPGTALSCGASAPGKGGGKVGLGRPGKNAPCAG